MNYFDNRFIKGKSLVLTSPIPPSVNHYLSYRAIIKNGKPLALSYCTNEAKKYKTDFTLYVKEQARLQGYKLVPDKKRHFYVDAVAYFPRVDMDISNYWKVLLDAITDTGMIWVDDNVVCERAQMILYDTENPRLELFIHPVDYIGVFKDASHLENFVSKCIDCARYDRNCSILQKAKDGKVQEEIKDNVCKKFNRTKGER